MNFYEDVGTNLANEGLKGNGTDHGQIGPEMDKKLNEIEAKTEEVEEEKKEVMFVFVNLKVKNKKAISLLLYCLNNVPCSYIHIAD